LQPEPIAAHIQGVDSKPRARGRDRALRLALFVAAVVGLLAGLNIFFTHLTTDPLTDVHAYYDAGARLNAGLELYPAGADTDAPQFYRYPPLLAIVFRPLALLPYGLAAAIWECLVLAAFAFSVWRIGNKRSTWLALGILALPIGWALAVGQAQVIVTALLVVGSPWAVALAGHIKLFPMLVGVYWLGRRDWTSIRHLVFWFVAITAVQLVLEPAGSLAFLGFPNLAQVGDINNLSPFSVSPPLWAALVVVGTVVALKLAPGRWGWAAAVVLAVLVTPRLLSYQLSSLLAALREPRAQRELE
jgi:hypothetical protein